MRTTDTFKQYCWLVNTIYLHKKISLKHIQKLWIDDDLNNGKPLSRPTFFRLTEAIEEMFGLIIICERKNGYQYFISNPEALKDNSTQNWMLQTLTVNNILIDSLSIKDRIVLEEIPSGLVYLPTIIKAIKSHHTLSMRYKKFNDSEPYSTLIEPYCLKLFHQRWYLLGKSERKNGKMAIYALDRIIKLEETAQTFEMCSDFNASEFFKNHFGVFIGENEKPTHIVIRAYGKTMISLMRTLPKHTSQKEIATEKEYADFEYFLVPSLDFKHEILKEGPDLEILKPQSLRNEIKTKIQESLRHYQ